MRKTLPIARSRSSLSTDRANPRVAAVLVTLLYSSIGGCFFDVSGLAPADENDASTAGDIDAAAPGSDATNASDGPPSITEYRKPITISAEHIDQDLTDFPVLVTLDDPELQQRATDDGRDIHFVASDGATLLSHEIEIWARPTGHLSAWVRLPLITASSDTTFYIVYGDENAAFPRRDPDVWRNDFIAVWHLEEDPAPATPDGIRDSTDNAPGTATPGMDNAQVAGPIEGAIRFQNNGDTIHFINPLLGGTSHTMSVWVDQNSTFDNDALITIGNGACQQSRWFYGRFHSTTVAAGFYCNDFGDSNSNVQNAGWTLLHWTYDANTRVSRIFRDGAVLNQTHTHYTGPDTQGTTGMLGSAPEPSFGSNMGLDGAIDEARIATALRSDAWIAAEFANQKTPEQFYAVGAEEPLP